MNTSSKFIICLSAGAFAFITSCKKTQMTDSVVREPVLPEQPYSYGSAHDDKMVALGRVLFYEVQLSANNTVSCGTCHVQSLAFSDGKKFSTGLADKLTARNTPAITSESERTGLFWDSRAASFEDLVLMPVTNHTEMGIIDPNTLPKKLQKLGYYYKLFNEAYGTSEITRENIQRSMAAFLSALNRPHTTKYELGGVGQIQNNNLNAIENIGLNVYMKKGKCNSCHGLSSFQWRDAANIGLEMEYTDKGMGESNSSQEGIFRIPGLYNIELTAPYMHDGRFKTLEEVVEHYNSGVKPHKNLDWRLKNRKETNGNVEILDEPQSLQLTDLEKKGLVAFLKTLTDWEYVTDRRFNNPFLK
jgi:cytochrome c peroxidase